VEWERRIRSAAQARFDPAVSRQLLRSGTIALLNDRGLCIVLPFDGGDPEAVLHATLRSYVAAPASSICGGFILDHKRRLLVCAVPQNPGARAAP
jgi:hypothetical protein